MDQVNVIIFFFFFFRLSLRWEIGQGARMRHNTTHKLGSVRSNNNGAVRTKFFFKVKRKNPFDADASERMPRNYFWKSFFFQRTIKFNQILGELKRKGVKSFVFQRLWLGGRMEWETNSVHFFSYLIYIVLHDKFLTRICLKGLGGFA